MQAAYEPKSSLSSNSIYAGYLVEALKDLIESSKESGRRQPVQELLSKVNEGEVGFCVSRCV